MTYHVTNNRNGFAVHQIFSDYDSALQFYASECAEIGGPVVLTRFDDEGNLDAVLHNTRG